MYVQIVYFNNTNTLNKIETTKQTYTYLIFQYIFFKCVNVILNYHVVIFFINDFDFLTPPSLYIKLISYFP